MLVSAGTSHLTGAKPALTHSLLFSSNLAKHLAVKLLVFVCGTNYIILRAPLTTLHYIWRTVKRPRRVSRARNIDEPLVESGR